MPAIQNKSLPPLPGVNLILIVLLGMVVFLPGLVQAQGNITDQVGDFIERNNELLEWARDIVAETESVTARRVLQGAFRLHERSLTMAAQSRPLNALGVARRSRAAIWRAVSLAREALSFEERLRLRSERFRDLHSNLLDLARERNDSRALDFVRRAENQAVRAREQFLQGDAKRAFKLLEQAEQLLNRAARLLADGAGPERLDRELERTANMLEQARERLGEAADPAALNLMVEADEALDRAREHRDQGQPGRALQMAGLARKLAGRARAMTSAGPDAETARQQLDRWDERAVKVAQKVEESGSEPARRHLELARQHRTRAGQALSTGEIDNALRQIRAAHDQLAQAEGRTR